MSKMTEQQHIDVARAKEGRSLGVARAEHRPSKGEAFAGLTALRRWAVMVVMMIAGVTGAWGQTNHKYVIFSNGHFLGTDGTSVTAPATFDKASCVWTTTATSGNSGTLSMNVGGTDYYLKSDLSVTTSSGDVFYLGATGHQFSTAESDGYLTYSESAWTISSTAADNGYLLKGYYSIQWYRNRSNDNATSDYKGLNYLGKYGSTDYLRGISEENLWAILRYDDDYSLMLYLPTGQFLICTETASGKTNAVHLEVPETLGTSSQYKISTTTYQSVSNLFYIQPYGSTCSLNAFSGNTANIGIYKIDDGGSLWHVNDPLLEKPTITESDGTVTISSSIPGATYYYTTDEKKPTLFTCKYPNAPHTTTKYTASFTVPYGRTTIKAILVDPTTHYTSGVQELTVTHIDATVRINISATGMVTLTSSMDGCDIYYNINSGTDPTSASTHYTGTFEVHSGDVIKAISVYEDLTSAVSSTTFYQISSISSITDMNGYYVLTADDDASSHTSINGFVGTFDGNYHTLSGLTLPLFTSLNGATVKNVILDNVTLSSSLTVNGTACLGAFTAYAQGNTKIYNCGIISKAGTSSISGGDNTGSIVGYITDNTRVVNNYSYANVTGGSYVGGIVGRVAGTSLSNSNYAIENHCAVTNNMFYGNLSGSSNVSPVYAGNHTSNVQNTNEYNYWRSRATVSYNNYNNQLAIDKDAYLNRFPFYRHILNNHREIAAIYLFGSRTDEGVAEIGHWYNVKNDASLPYPIIETWRTNTKRTTVDIAANLPNTTEDYAGKKLTEMGISGVLRVNVSINGSTFTSDLPITDMDSLNYDFTWGKVVLPFANEYEGWTRDYSMICTGWKITSVTGGTSGTLTNYNFADRNCTAKDIYNATTNPYIFAQGGNYIVPYGVTAITIEANFADAFYLSDEYYDYGYNVSYGEQTALTTKVPTTYHGQTVYTNLNTLLGTLGAYADPHHQAIVLVGNYHYNQNTIGGNLFESHTGKGLTIMSVDEDCNQEPDYGWYSYHTKDRTPLPPMRFDFVPNIGIGMAARTTGSTPYPTIGIWHSKGWFELTETCVSFMSECEINDGNDNDVDDGHGNNRWIANSGYFIQIVRARSTNANKLSYLQIGGNAYVKELYPGSHTDSWTGSNNPNTSTTLRPIVVTGGEIEDCYMTGYNASAPAVGDNIYFWCAGGRIHKYLSAYLENPSSGNVNVTAKVDHARIYRFFGGGTSQGAKITGNIEVTMNNSKVDFYCGGPEFGNMSDNKTVTTHATGTTFGQYYGAGFGGTSITYNREDNNGSVSFSDDKKFPLGWGGYKRLAVKANYGIGSCYKFEYILYSGGGGTGVARFYTGYAAFDLAKTGNVTNELNHCTVTGDFYGAGCQGTVNGTVESTLTDCTLKKNAFGGGYKATSNEVSVYTGTQPTYSTYKKETGIFSDFGTGETETFNWQQRATAGSDDTNKILFTTTDMSQLGTVSGKITLNINGSTTVAESVYGGGNESPASNDTEVNIEGNVQVAGDVYGGGNQAIVGGSTKVNIK